MPESIRILMAEDLPTDAELAEREIRQVLKMCVFQRVETREAYLAALETFQPDLIISDYRMPRFDGLTALQLAIECAPLTPVIILTGAINEDTAVACMKAGASDYVIKEHIKRLGQAVIHALDQKQLHQERSRAEHALRASEERYRTLAHTLPDAITVTDAAGNITYISPITLHFYGYEHEDEMLGRNVLAQVHVSYHQRALDQIAVVLAGGSISSEEYILLKKDGSPFYGEVSAACLKDPQGQAIGIIIIMRDITKRKQAEEMSAKLEDQLHQAQRMESIGRLAGGIAHDFNNLLTVIHGYCDIIQDQLASADPLLVELRQIQQASERATALTRQLLAFSRKQILAPTVLDLNSLVMNLRAMLARLIGEDITLDTVLGVGLRPIIADPSQIEQVIMNLVVNARDAMPTGGRLTLETGNIDLDRDYASTHPEAPVGSCVMLAVTDTGCGMDAQTSARIFEPFFTTKESGKGTGLGLATVYGIIKQSDGEITVASEPGQGATFTIFLPASAVAPSARSAPQPRSAARGGSETILLAEDEETVREMVSRALQAQGYNVLEACHGAEALALSEQYQQPIDLLVTDVVMPQMSGGVLAERLTLLRPQLKVLFMSGYMDDAVVRHGLPAVEMHFLAKPFSLSVLVAKVREVLDAANDLSRSNI
jgi:PAS domain S-box-containing protein